MGRSRDEAQAAADTFLDNCERGDHEANDKLVRDQDPRDAFIVDADE